MEILSKEKDWERGTGVFIAINSKRLPWFRNLVLVSREHEEIQIQKKTSEPISPIIRKNKRFSYLITKQNQTLYNVK